MTYCWIRNRYTNWMTQIDLRRNIPHLWRNAVLLLTVVVIANLSAFSNAAPKEEKSKKAEPKDYMRVVQTEDGKSRLDMAARTFVPIKGKGPTITLVAAIHIADADFFRIAQIWLDAQDLVLFEGVGDDHMRSDPDSVEHKIEKTKRRVRHTAIMLERYKRHYKAYPKSLEALTKTVAKFDAIKGNRLRRATKDAWAQPLRYKIQGNSFQLSSLGADEKPGGDKDAQDIRMADLPKPSKVELDPNGKTGIQSEMASALGLAFQLNAYDTGKENYRNSDMTIEQLKARVAKSGSQLGPFLKMMDGSSVLASVMKFGLGMIRNNPQMQTMVKLLLMETLSQHGNDIAKAKGIPKSMQTVLRVLIEDRNQTVINDLKKEINKKKPAQSIGVWYGAGHMRDLEQRLRDQLKYRPVGGFWLPAMTIDLEKSGVSKQQIDSMRKMIQKLK